MQPPGQTKFLVLGANGQVGSALNVLLENVICLGRENADLSRPATLPEIVRAIQPDVLINAAAYTQVDKAETEEGLAFTINAEAPGVLAKTAAEMNIPFIHYSTDYVFDGSGNKPWVETDKTRPLNVYGKSKLAGEEAVMDAGGKHLIFRTSWVYDAYGKNFLNTMLRLGSEREKITVVNDQFGAPTYSPHLAKSSLQALENALGQENFPSGIYHLCAAGETTWYGFAEKIFSEARTRDMDLKLQTLEAIASSLYPTPAPRPQNSRLDCGKAKEILDVSLPNWNDGLVEAIKEKQT